MNFDPAKAFRALGDSTRIAIVKQLQAGSQCACKLLEAFPLSQPTMSYHLNLLVKAGLLTAEKHGTWMHYSLDQDHLQALQAWIAEVSNQKE